MAANVPSFVGGPVTPGFGPPTYGNAPLTPTFAASQGPAQTSRQYNKGCALFLWFCFGPCWRIYVDDFEGCLLQWVASAVVPCVCWLFCILDVVNLEDLLLLAERGGKLPLIASTSRIQRAFNEAPQSHTMF